ncbi:MAG: flavin reductase family protein [Bacteroidetes bacterium]|nr:MAG: flavin reductase family protein [Bacteroidota bacterium]
MRTFTPEELTPRQRHHYILGSINPRPICFASTLDKEGRPNLAPYSFFNVFSSTPPILIFSVNTRRDGSLKDTLNNVRETGEVVINLVNYPMARQMAICGVEYDTGINEFEKGGFTPVASEMVKPFRVKESPVQFECKVLEVKALSDKPGAANLIVAQALLIHAQENIFSDDDTIDPRKIDMVGRLGNFNYCRANGESIFAIQQPPAEIAIGFDNLPAELKTSKVLTGHHLAMLAGVTEIPAMEDVDKYVNDGADEMNPLLSAQKTNEKETFVHEKIKELLNNGETRKAWLFYLATQNNSNSL